MEPMQGEKEDGIAEGSSSSVGEQADVREKFVRGTAERVAGRRVHRSSRAGCNVRYTNPKTHLSLGTAYLEEGMVDDAVAEFRLAREAAHCEVDAAVGLARCYLRKSAFDQALAVLAEALDGGFRRGDDVTRLHRQIALVRRYRQGCLEGDPEEETAFCDLPGDPPDSEDSFQGAEACREERNDSLAQKPQPVEEAILSSELIEFSPREVVEFPLIAPEEEEILFHALENPPEKKKPAQRSRNVPRPVKAKFVIRHSPARPGTDQAAEESKGLEVPKKEGAAPVGGAGVPSGVERESVKGAKEPAQDMSNEGAETVPEKEKMAEREANVVSADGEAGSESFESVPVAEAPDTWAGPLPEPAQRLDEAFDALRSDAGWALEENPEEHYRLGISYLETGVWEDACNEFQKAMKDEGRFFDCVLRIARCRIHLGNFELAIADLEEAVSREDCPGDKAISLRYEMVRAAEQAGDSERVARELERIDAARREESEEPAPARPEALAMEAAPVNRRVTWVFFAAIFLALTGGWHRPTVQSGCF